MAEQRGLRRLTRADVVAIGAVCLLLILLVPVLFAKPREQAVRKVCAANLAQIGKAVLVYAGDNKGEFPRAGGRSTVWGGMPFNTAWTAADRRIAFTLAADGSGGSASINASFYLLVKYQQLPPRVFVCKGDEGTTEWKLSECNFLPSNFELIDAWDFGPPDESFKHCSYAYHMPYTIYPLSTSLDPNLAVAADRNPWIISPASHAQDWTKWRPDVSYLGGVVGTPAQACMGNSITHRRDGQNVLFLDGRVTFEKRAYCGVEKDNVYTISRDITGHGDPYGIGLTPTGLACMPASRKDSVLVHDAPSVYSQERR